MSANRNAVEHAITESLNGKQLGDKNVVGQQLADMRHNDPQHWRENLQLFNKMTHDIPGFPHVELTNDRNLPTGNPAHHHEVTHPTVQHPVQHEEPVHVQASRRDVKDNTPVPAAPKPLDYTQYYNTFTP